MTNNNLNDETFGVVIGVVVAVAFFMFLFLFGLTSIVRDPNLQSEVDDTSLVSTSTLESLGTEIVPEATSTTAGSEVE